MTPLMRGQMWLVVVFLWVACGKFDQSPRSENGVPIELVRRYEKLEPVCLELMLEVHRMWLATHHDLLMEVKKRKEQPDELIAYLSTVEPACSNLAYTWLSVMMEMHRKVFWSGYETYFANPPCHVHARKWTDEGGGSMRGVLMLRLGDLTMRAVEIPSLREWRYGEEPGTEREP